MKKVVKNKKGALPVRRSEGTHERHHEKKRVVPKKKPIPEEDSRFDKAAYDPRFLSEDTSKSAIDLEDDRFSKMFTDDAFTEEYEVDEYGKPLNKSNKDKLAAFYQLSKSEVAAKQKKRDDDLREYGADLMGEQDDQEESDEEEEDQEAGVLDEDEDEDAEGSLGEEGEEDEFGDFEEEDDYEDESDDGEDIEDAMKRYLADADDDEEVITRDDVEATSRLAVLNMDWTRIQAHDVLAVLLHFAPPGGTVLKVTVYPSEFGKQQMAKEAIHGPDDVWKDTSDTQGVKKAYRGLDEHKLRRYEKNVLRYYYAIAECDSTKTAAHIYEACDDIEFEDSVNLLDIRFVSPSEKFTNKPRETATKVPKDYVPPDVFTKALGHSVQELSWDKSDKKRQNLLNVDYSRNQLKDMSYETFVEVMNSSEDESGSDEEENGEGEQVNKKSNGKGVVKDKAGSGKVANPEDKKKMKAEQARQKYMGTLLKGFYGTKAPKEELTITFGDSAGEHLTSVSDEEDESMDREITFTPGLEDRAKEIQKEKDFKGLSAWEQHLKKKDEKKKAVKNAKVEKAKSAMEERVQAIQNANKPKKKGETEEDKANKERLELLLAGDKEVEKGFNVRQLVEEEKNKGKKTKKEKKLEKRQQDGFKLNVDDPRFGAIFKNQAFAIDPNDPAYKKTQGMLALEKEALNRTYDKSGAPLVAKKTQDTEDWDTSVSVNALKRKFANNHPTSKAKQSKK